MLAAGVVNGFGASILWVGQGKYITDCSDDTNKGFHFGLFWCLFMLSQIIGSLISAFLLKLFSQTIFFIIMSAFAFCGFGLFLFLAKPILNPQKKKLNRSENDDIEEEDEDIVDPSAPLMQQDINKTPKNEDLEINSPVVPEKASLSSTIKLLFQPNMLKTVALIIASGLIIAIYSSFLVKLISNTVKDEDEKLTKALYCMILFGVGEVTGALTLGKVIDHSNKIGII